ncbi:hypothetical protein [Methylogaea oryzae]|uniref:hypothetical protein n=1 Tax=Methylogaea oryzae TaxID=1295382 RepID=UPI0006D0C397|nr:hypothetical protein [Methylogaea oryzae]
MHHAKSTLDKDAPACSKKSPPVTPQWEITGRRCSTGSCAISLSRITASRSLATNTKASAPARRSVW